MLDSKTRLLAAAQHRATAAAAGTGSLAGMMLAGVNPAMLSAAQVRCVTAVSRFYIDTMLPCVTSLFHASLLLLQNSTACRVYVGRYAVITLSGQTMRFSFLHRMRSLHYDIGEPEIRALFSPFGRILKVDVSYEPATGKSKVRMHPIFAQRLVCLVASC